MSLLCGAQTRPESSLAPIVPGASGTKAYSTLSPRLRRAPELEMICSQLPTLQNAPRSCPIADASVLTSIDYCKFLFHQEEPSYRIIAPPATQHIIAEAESCLLASDIAQIINTTRTHSAHRVTAEPTTSPSTLLSRPFIVHTVTPPLESCQPLPWPISSKH